MNGAGQCYGVAHAVKSGILRREMIASYGMAVGGRTRREVRDSEAEGLKRDTATLLKSHTP